MRISASGLGTLKFILTVASADAALISSVKLNFALERRVTGITFDKEVIEF